MIDNKEIMLKNKQNLRDLENMYVNSQIDNLDELIESRKEELIGQLAEYKVKCMKIAYDKSGLPYEKINLNPFVMQKYFFKTINPMTNREPAYNAEKLAIVWDLYQEILCNVNVEIGDFAPTLTSFCTFAGITTNTLRNWKKSNDLDMRTVVEKINDACFDANITLAQQGQLKERTTIYRMKSEQDKAEKEQPQIHLHNHNDNKVDVERLEKRLAEIQGYHKKKSEVIEVEKSE